MEYSVFNVSPMDKDVLSPRSRLGLTILQISAAFDSILKKFQSPFHQDFDLDVWWHFHPFPAFCLWMAFDDFVAFPLDLHVVSMLLAAVVMLGQSILLYCLVYWNTYTPFQLLGAKRRFMIEFFPVIILSVWHQFLVIKLGGLSLEHFLEFNYGPICLLLACTSYFYLLAHILHRAYDITAQDVLVGLTMQVLCFMVCGDLFIRLVILSCCIGLIIQRYMTYSAPAVLPQPKRESELLPC